MADWFETFLEDLWLPKGVSRQPEADFIRRALRLRKGERVLDAPCGDGEVAIHLARMGIHVTGVDITPRFISRARRRFRSQKLPGEFRVMDLRQLDYEEQFDAAYNWFGSFGYFSNTDNLDVLRRLAGALRQGGRLLIEQINRERILRRYGHSHQGGDVRTVRRVARWRPETQRLETVHTRQRGGRRQQCRSSMRLYTPGQFRHLLVRAGLRVAAVFGDWEGNEYHRGSRRLVVAARKK